MEYSLGDVKYGRGFVLERVFSTRAMSMGIEMYLDKFH